jgi:glutamyl-tRNA synthetase/nondiscriminating glutamyl-tRNA synthetase
MQRRERSGASIATNAFGSADVASILRERGWHTDSFSEEQTTWCERAAALLGAHAADRDAIAAMLALIFQYDAAEIIARKESHAVLARYGAREVVRQFALSLLEGGALTSERFSEIVATLKSNLEARGRELFHPIRLAVAGRAGEGELDRVILLLDSAAEAHFAVKVRRAQERMLEFCAALD